MPMPSGFTPSRNCAEIAHNVPGIVAVRDSKDPEGPVLATTPADWSAFTTAVKAGALGA